MSSHLSTLSEYFLLAEIQYVKVEIIIAKYALHCYCSVMPIKGPGTGIDLLLNVSEIFTVKTIMCCLHKCV